MIQPTMVSSNTTKPWICFVTEVKQWQKGETNTDKKKTSKQHQNYLFTQHRQWSHPEMQWPGAPGFRPSEGHRMYTSVASRHRHRVRTSVPSHCPMVRAIDCTLPSPPFTGLKNYIYIRENNKYLLTSLKIPSLD